MRVRTLTVAERLVWGKCPACGAKDGEPCDSDVGISLSPDRPQEGAHIARLDRAPRRVKEVRHD